MDITDTFVSLEEAFAMEGAVITSKTKSTIIYDSIVPKIKESVLLNVRSIIRHIGSYIDRNSENLLSPGIYHKISYDDVRDGDVLFKWSGTTKKEVADIIDQSPEITKGLTKIMDNAYFKEPSLYLMCAMANIYKETSGKLYDDAAGLVALFMTIKFYAAREAQLFKFDPKKEIMDYTINNLTNKFTLKREGSIIGMLNHITKVNELNVGVELRKNHLDSYYKYYIQNLRTSVYNSVMSVHQEYLLNHENKKYLNASADYYTGNSGADVLGELNNLSASITNIVQRVYSQMKRSSLDDTLLKDCGILTKVSINSIRYTLDDVIHNETDLLREMILCILQIYLTDPKNKISSIKSREFARYCLNIYRTSNTNDDGVLRIKDILNEWIQKYGAHYIRLNREATLVNFRKAIFFYITESIIKFA